MIESKCHRIIIAFVLLATLVGSSLFSLNAAAIVLQRNSLIANPVPAPDAISWKEQPQNHTLEYGEEFKYQVNLTGGVGYWWFVSDNLHFRISASAGADLGIIRSNGDLSIGVYYLRITVWDQNYVRLTADIWITVQDSFYPEIEGPENIEFTQGERNHNISWVAYDANPYYYVISKSGGDIEEGHWLEPLTVFTIALGFLPSGTFIYKLTLWDHGNNSAYSSVIVHVHQNETAQSDSTQDPYVRTGEIEKIVYVPKPDIMFIEFFAIIILTGLTGLVMISALGTKKHEFGFT